MTCASSQGTSSLTNVRTKSVDMCCCNYAEMFFFSLNLHAKLSWVLSIARSVRVFCAARFFFNLMPPVYPCYFLERVEYILLCFHCWLLVLSYYYVYNLGPVDVNTTLLHPCGWRQCYSWTPATISGERHKTKVAFNAAFYWLFFPFSDFF